MNETKIIPLNQIHTLDFELTSFFAQRQIWIDGVLFSRETQRHASALIFLSGCTGIYTDLENGNSFFAPCKSLVYLPYASRYTVLNVDSKIHKPDAYLIEFNMHYNEDCFALFPRPFMINYVNQVYIENTMREIVDCYESVPFSPPLLKAKIYNILSHLSCSENTDKDKIYETIFPALEHMNNSPYDSTTIEEYAQMCGLSCGGFRRLFKDYTGKSPRKHMIDKKLSAAKILLEESEISINEISDILNYESTSYFCRLFKNRIGKTPSEFRESIRQNNRH